MFSPSCPLYSVKVTGDRTLVASSHAPARSVFIDPCPVAAFIWLSCSGCPVLTVLELIANIGCPAFALLSWVPLGFFHACSECQLTS